MIQSGFGHIQVNIQPTNMQFYKDLFTFLGWKLLLEMPDFAGFGEEHGGSIWFTPPQKADARNDYDGIGMNHLAICVPHQADVDQTVEYLKAHQVACLFETPRHRPDFCESEAATYYQVMFESPDRVLFEVVYTGPKE